MLHHCDSCLIVQICSGAELGAQDKDDLTPLMLAAINGRESTFNVMIKTEEGIKVVRNTLLQLAQGQHQLAGHKTTVSEHLKVSAHVLHMISDNVKLHAHFKNYSVKVTTQSGYVIIKMNPPGTNFFL